MKLTKDDILQKGDLVHWNNTPNVTEVNNAWGIGHCVSYLVHLDYVERPDAPVDYAAQVRQLREALEECVRVIRVEGFSGAAERAAIKLGETALDATK